MHDDEDPEYSILKQRMVNRMKEEGITDVSSNFGLADITKVAERSITAVSGAELAGLDWAGCWLGCCCGSNWHNLGLSLCTCKSNGRKHTIWQAAVSGN